MKKYRLLALTLAFVILISLQTVYAYSTPQYQKEPIGKSEIYIFGSYEDSSGNKHGTYSKLIVEVYRNPGHGGKVYIEAMPIPDKMFYASSIIASKTAAIYSGISYYDLEFYYSIIGSSVSIEGPSAGAAMTLAAISAIMNLSIPKDIGITGMILPGGIIGPVGSLKEKIEAASSLGVKHFLVPYGQSEAPVSLEPRYVSLREYANSLGIELIDVLTTRDVLRIVFNLTLPFNNTSALKTGEMDLIREYLINSSMEDLKLLNSMLKDIESRLKNITIPDFAKDYFNEFITYFNETYSQALGYLEIENYYSALSKLFQASVYLRAADYLTRYYLSDYPAKTLGEFYSEVLNEIAQIESLLKDYITTKMTLNDFYKLGATQFRILEAKYYLELFNTTIAYPEDIPSALYYLAFAKERARTAVWWYQLPEINESNTEIDFYPIVMENIAYAQSIIELLEGVQINSSDISTIKEYTWINYKSLELGYYPGAFFASSAIISTATLIFFKTYLSSDYLSKVADSLQETLITIISNANTSAHFVITSTLEYGQALRNTSIESSLYMFVNGLVLASLYTSNQSMLSEWELEPNQQIEINIKEGVRAEIFFIIGLIAGVVLGIALFSKD